MQNGNGKQPQGVLSALIGEETPAKRAGLSYTLFAFAYVGVAFLFLLLPVGEDKPDWYLYCTFLVSPAAFLLVIGWYFSFTKTSFKVFFKEQRCHPKYYLLAFTLQLGLLSLGELNGLFLKLLGGFGYEDSGIAIPATKGLGLLGVLLVVAVLPAVAEEFFFRGVFQREMRSFSLPMQVLLCGGLFALYHQNPAQTVYQLCCGGAFALIAARSGSFLPTVLSHFLNNAVVIILYALGVESYPLAVYIPLMLTAGVSLVGTLLYLIFFDKGEKKENTGSLLQLFACAGAGIFVFGISWIATLYAGL